MTEHVPIAKDTVIDSMTAIIDYLQFVNMSLTNFVALDTEALFLDASELAGLSQTLHCARVMAEECYTLHLMELKRYGTAGSLVVYAMPKQGAPNSNPIIQNTLHETLYEIINSLQFLATILDHIELNGEDKLLTTVEVMGLSNTVNSIKIAAEHGFNHCYAA